MRTMKHLTLAAVAVAALALAGCGGSSKKVQGTPPADTPPVVEETPAGKAGDALGKAEAAKMKAMMAKETADKALADAKMKADMLDIWSTGGDSTVVAANAQAILDAKTAIEAEKTKAEQAKAEAEAQKAEVDKLPADTPGLAVFKKRIDDAIMEADEQIKAIEKLLSGSITTYVSKVTGSDGKGTPATLATAIAKRIAEGLAGSGGFTRDTSVRVSIDAPSSTPPEKAVTTGTYTTRVSKAVEMHNAPDFAKTWEEIVGEDLMKRPFGADNQDVDVLSLAGEPISTLTTVDGTPLTAFPDDGDFTGAGGSEDTYYMGISGKLYCSNIGACEVDGTTMKGPLYFRSTESKRYHMKAGDSHYSEYENYVRYGYWVKAVSPEPQVRFGVFAYTPGNGTVDIATPASDANGLAATATYKGKALGLSTMKVFDSSGDVTEQKSGQFTADVTLNAEFDNTPALGGTVNNFVGDAADPKWSVELKQFVGNSSSTFILVGNTAEVAQGSGGSDVPAGTWEVRPHGESSSQAATMNKRPTGFVGNFLAHFKNGAAIGAFGARGVVTE